MTQSRLSTDILLDDLRQLCALPSSQEPHDDSAAVQLARLMQRRGLQTEIMPTAGAPVVVGRRSGRSPFTLLLYHHYDAAPLGSWRAWNHDPSELAEREGELFGRGVAHGKGPLAAHLAALDSLITSDDELPIGVVVVADGEALRGSPHLGTCVAAQPELFRADACLASTGERDTAGIPICYSGAKGLLQLRLTTIGANHMLPAGFAATVPNPAWQLVWALASLKSDQEEILVDGFYDDVKSPSRAEHQALRGIALDEANRLAAWGIDRFLFDMQGATLTIGESTLPTCNISALTVEPAASAAAIPVVATANVDFQLVPNQRPKAVLELVREHLKQREYTSINIERVDGGYPATSTPIDDAFVERVRAIGQQSYGAALARLPLGPFALPLFFFAEAFYMPTAAVGCARNNSSVYGPNEHIQLADLVNHAQLLFDLVQSYDDRR